MDYILSIGIVSAIFVTVVISGIVSDKRQEKRFRQRLKNEFGKVIKTEYSKERNSSLRGYLDAHSEMDDLIDDITWNDLEGDRIYRYMNHSYSSVGDEYLYYLLHKPCYDKSFETREVHFNEVVEFFRTHEKEREDLQVIFARLGRTGSFSIYQYLGVLNSLYEGKKGKGPYLIKYLFRWVILVALIIFLLFYPLPGIVALVVYLIILICSYFFLKKDIEPFLTSFDYILRMLRTIETLQNYPIDVLSDEKKILLDLRRKLSAVSTANLVFMKTGSNSMGAGDLMALAVGTIKMITHIDLYLFERMLYQVVHHKEEIDEIITMLGTIESTISVASFRECIPNWCNPIFHKKDDFSIQEGYSPLIEEAVPNSFCVKEGMLVTGSNASGKSTFLRMTAICALLAETIYTVPAISYKAPRFRIYSSISIKDCPELKESYYMVEIKSVRRMMKAMEDSKSRVLIFIDEVLRGTNTIERIAAASEIIRYFVDGNATIFAATHDRELTYILEDCLKNFHFEEKIEEDDIHFPFKLMEGRSNSQNAIRLLALMDYPDSVVKRAKKRADGFLESGEW